MANAGFIEPPPGLFGPSTSTPRERSPQIAPLPAAAPDDAAPAGAHAAPAESASTPSFPEPPRNEPPAPAPQSATQQPVAAPAPPPMPTGHEAPAKPEPPRPRVDSASGYSSLPAQAAPAAPAAPRAEPIPNSSIPLSNHVADGTVPLRYDASNGGLPPFPRFADVELPNAPAMPVTRAAQPTPALQQAALVLALPDGERIPVTGAMVLGRNPAQEQFPGEIVRALQDPTRTMSKTHARVVAVDGVVKVDDLNSTNGVAVLPGGSLEQARAVDPGTPLAAQPGDIIQLGEYPIVVEATN
ncbi:FHA domain-containing protein [Pseudoclavibacter albus]|uniref:FHA domain-containing protein n=1 Tax=Pseudoclavibacter albus TaxID=272241 RepID=UPI000A89AAE0|nr:FHA domain-containing protein [Pseudoclavibacter alba]